MKLDKCISYFDVFTGIIRLQHHISASWTKLRQVGKVLLSTKRSRLCENTSNEQMERKNK